MSRFITHLAFFMLSLMVFSLYSIGLYQTVRYNHIFSTFVLIVILLFMFLRIKKGVAKIKTDFLRYCIPSFKHNQLKIIGIVTAASVITFTLNNYTDLSSVTASSLVGLIGALLFPKKEVPIYCGSFVGMTGAGVLTGIETVIIAGLISGILLAGTEPLYVGFGGKLGACAFFGAMITALFTNRFVFSDPNLTPQFDIMIPVLLVIGTVGTLWIRDFAHHSAVISSGIIGIAGSLILPSFFPINGLLYATTLFCGTFVGMSAMEHLKNYKYTITAALMCALCYFYTSPIFPGKGGKLGALAFGAMVATSGMMEYYNDLHPKKPDLELIEDK